jgi:hypothetical protein
LALEAVLALAVAGCSPDGTGSVKIENPDAVRSGAGRGEAPISGQSAKKAKVQQTIEEAVKKHPKLQ